MSESLDPEMKQHLERLAAGGDRNARQVLGAHDGDVADTIRWLARNVPEFYLPQDQVEELLADYGET